jgi:hypothetical protein
MLPINKDVALSSSGEGTQNMKDTSALQRNGALCVMGVHPYQ